MATIFTYRAVAPDGKLRAGTLAGENDRAVAKELQRQGLTPIAISSGVTRGMA